VADRCIVKVLRVTPTRSIPCRCVRPLGQLSNETRRAATSPLVATAVGTFVVETFVSIGLETIVPLPRPSERVQTATRLASSFISQPEQMVSAMRSYAAFNEEVVKRYEEWLVVQHYRPRTKQFYRRMVRTFSDYFDLKPDQAKSIAAEVGIAVSGWRREAKRAGITDSEINRMASAFDHEDLRKATELANKKAAP
jgi:hypothetical protein